MCRPVHCEMVWTSESECLPSLAQVKGLLIGYLLCASYQEKHFPHFKCGSLHCNNLIFSYKETLVKNNLPGASLVAQWLRIYLPMQGTRVRALVWEDPTCRGATGPVSHSCWACASGACAPQQERPRLWEARAPRWRVAPACHNWRKPSRRNEDPTQPKINK